MKLEGGRQHRRAIRPALPSVDRKFLLKLLQLEIAAHPPQAAVLSLTLTAEAGQSSKVQLGLFAPQTPEPSRLDVTMARLKAIVGEDRVGSPVLEDTHRAGSFRMEGFLVVRQSYRGSKAQQRPRMALRRMRPPVPVRVELRATKARCLSRSREQLRDRSSLWSMAHAAVAGGPPMAGTTKSGTCWPRTGNGASVACLLVADRARERSGGWRLL